MTYSDAADLHLNWELPLSDGLSVVCGPGAEVAAKHWNRDDKKETF